MEREKYAVRVSGVLINGSAPPDTTFSSDAILMNDKPWSLNVWFSSLTAEGAQPTVKLMVSSDEENLPSNVDTLSFNPLENGFATVPRGFKSEFFKYKYLRIVYTANSATSSGLMYFDLVQEI